MLSSRAVAALAVASRACAATASCSNGGVAVTAVAAASLIRARQGCLEYSGAHTRRHSCAAHSHTKPLSIYSLTTQQQWRARSFCSAASASDATEGGDDADDTAAEAAADGGNDGSDGGDEGSSDVELKVVPAPVVVETPEQMATRVAPEFDGTTLGVRLSAVGQPAGTTKVADGVQEYIEALPRYDFSETLEAEMAEHEAFLKEPLSGDEGDVDGGSASEGEVEPVMHLDELLAPDEYPIKDDPLLTNLLFDPNQLWWKTVQTLNYPINERDLDRKVKLLVKVDRLGLPDRVALFVKALCGPRYNVRTGWLKLTYQSYPEMRQNKRYLLELLQRLIEEAAALAAEFPTGQVELTTASTAKSSKWLRKKDKGKKKKRRSKKHNSPG